MAARSVFTAFRQRGMMRDDEPGAHAASGVPMSIR